MNNTTKNFMNEISKQASLFLLVFALLSFVCLVVFKSDYYHSMFLKRFPDSISWTMAICIAVIVEGIRFSFMLSSAEDVRTGNRKGFVIGLIASLALLGYELYICKTVGEYWNPYDYIYVNILRFLAISGMVIELRLCLLISGKEAPKKEIKEPSKVNNLPFTLPILKKHLDNKNESANT